MAIRDLNKLRIYVASSFLNKKKAEKLMKDLNKLGFVIMSTWTGNPSNPDLKRLRKESQRDLEELRKSDVLVVLWPGRLGTNAEIGAALAMYKPVIIFGKVPLKKSVYFNHPKVQITSDREVMIRMLVYLEEYLYDKSNSA